MGRLDKSSGKPCRITARRACRRSRSELDSSMSEATGTPPEAVVFELSSLFVGFGILAPGESGRISMSVMSLGASALYTSTAAAAAIAAALGRTTFDEPSWTFPPLRTTTLPSSVPTNVPTVATTCFPLFSLSPRTSIRETVSLGIWIFPFG